MVAVRMGWRWAVTVRTIGHDGTTSSIAWRCYMFIIMTGGKREINNPRAWLVYISASKCAGHTIYTLGTGTLRHAPRLQVVVEI
jgi:hypothetical protein